MDPAADYLTISGGHLLEGDVEVSGSKNATLPILTASLIAHGKSTIKNAPDIGDVRMLSDVLKHLGADICRHSSSLTVDTTRLHSNNAAHESARKIRASILLLAPLLGRFGEARVALPGGCSIGSRPIQEHFKLELLGVKMTIDRGYIVARCPNGLRGARIVCDFPSVTATENLLIAASVARGTTEIFNCATEPEIVDLASALGAMGATIQGAGTTMMVVHGHGRTSLTPFTYEVMGDRIECGTLLMVGALLGMPLIVKGAVVSHQQAVIKALREMGVHISTDGHTLKVWQASRLRAIDIETGPYPSFPTDLQAPLMVLMTLARGTSTINETMFENRFLHVPELRRLGASIKIEGRQAVIRGRKRLLGSTVVGTDLRASASLVLAGLAADGQTRVDSVQHLDRGHERLDVKLGRVGAVIVRRSGSEIVSAQVSQGREGCDAAAHTAQLLVQ